MKGLESLERIENEYSIDEAVFYKKDFKQVRKELKALEIIKEKKVNILLLELAENVDEYNERIVPNGQLTEEEFNILKEGLEYE